MRRNLRLAALAVAIVATLAASAASAQSPAADWRTLATPHFRVHYPASTEEWTRRAAARLESIRERVIAEVGYAPPEIVDVVVQDPVAQPNGSAFPFLGWPRMILWTSPPGPESALGHYQDWSELLIVHEETHLVHLLRPSRRPLTRLLESMVPAGPVLLKAPRWVTEGYATVVEGRLTGLGRPNGDLRAAQIRRWAQAGKLPDYAHLASDSASYRGMSMAYLVGSAYLEWLDERAGPGSLRKLWARMTARQNRSFEDAFRGVFGDSPNDLYDRFRAETTYKALEIEKRFAAVAKPAEMEGELWQDLSWSTGAPALSADGEKLAIVLTSRLDPAKLVIWSTGPNDEAETKYTERLEKAMKADPEDFPPVRDKPLSRKALHTLEPKDGIAPTTPRFLPDGTVLFVRFEPDGEGVLHPDLSIWAPEKGTVRRITHGADLRDPDPSPDGRWAVAIRNRDGKSQVVRVDLGSGAVTALTEPSLSAVCDRPRVAPDGRRVAFARRSGETWNLAVLDVETKEMREIAPPPGTTVAAPAWSRDGKALFASVGENGFVDLYAFAIDGGTGPRLLTRTQGSALDPEPTPDGKAVFYLNLNPAGLDLYRLELAADAGEKTRPSAAELTADLAPAVRPRPPAAPAPFEVREVGPSRPYGLGRQEFLPLLGGSVASNGGGWEVGVRGGDVVGRMSYLALGGGSTSGWAEGGALAGAYRGLPVDIGLHLFQTREHPSEQRDLEDLGPRFGRALDVERHGAELALLWNHKGSGSNLELAGRALVGEVEPDGRAALHQRIAGLSGSYSAKTRLHGTQLTPSLFGRYERGTTGGESWSRYTAELGLTAVGHSRRLALSWRRDGSRDVLHAFDRFALGGAASSLLPVSAASQRILSPALPAGLLTGDEHEGQRVELSLGLPAPVFFERHRLWNDGQSKGEWLRLIGLESRFTLAPQPIGRIPAVDLRVGVARVLDEPLKDDTRWWVITVWRP